MEKTFFINFLVTQHPAKKNSPDNPSSMAPVVDAGHGKSENCQADYPTRGLFKNGFAQHSTSCLAIVQCRTYEAAYGGGCADGEINACKVGQIKTGYSAQCINCKHPMCTIDLDNKISYLCKSDHVEDNVQ